MGRLPPILINKLIASLLLNERSPTDWVNEAIFGESSNYQFRHPAFNGLVPATIGKAARFKTLDQRGYGEDGY
jgi:hypothetical protein